MLSQYPISGAALSSSFQTADTVAPTMAGSIAISTITSTSFIATWQAATDDISVTGYKVSKDGGSNYTDVGNVLSYSFTGLSASTAYPVRVYAYDAAGNNSTPLSTTATTSAAADVAVPVMVGVITSSNITSTSFSLTWQAATDNVAVTGYEVSLDAGATYTDAGNVLTVSKAALASATTYNTRVRAYDAAGNRASPLSLAVTTASAADVTLPVMVGSLTSSLVTSSGFALTWQAATDNVGVVGYEVSYDNGNSYANVGNVLTTSVSGLTASTLYNAKVRAYDGANNRATPISVAVTTTAVVVAPGGSLAQTSRGAMVTVPSAVTLGATANTIVYTRRGAQDLILYNKSASNATVNIVGSTAGSVFILGTGGGSISLVAGINIVAAPGYTLLRLDAAHEALRGVVSLTANSESVVTACLLA